MEQLDVQKPGVKKSLLEIQPRELKFTFEVKKQSSCAVHLANVTDQYVAFKVKTTSPKKYCVRPNIGVIKPKSTFDFTVTMQAQKSAPSDMQCKDKFLIQSTIAPPGATEEEITPDMVHICRNIQFQVVMHHSYFLLWQFAKESGKYVEECKLKVFLTSPTHSPVLSPVNGISKQEQSRLTKMEEEKLLTGVENNFSMPAKNFFDEKVAMDSEVLKLPAYNVKPNSDNEVGSRTLHDVEWTEKKLSRDIEELKSKLTTLDSELIKAKSNITKLTEEKSSAIQENQTLKQELVMMRRKMGGRIVERGFPPLFVCMVALISLTVGFLLHG